MKPLNLTIWSCHQLRRIGAIDFKATVDLSGLSRRSRNQVVIGLQWGWVRAMANSGTGLLTHKLLEEANVWFVFAKVRGWQQIYWAHATLLPPAGFIAGLEELRKADRTAAALTGKRVDDDGTSLLQNRGLLDLYCLKVTDHLPPLLEPHVRTHEYRSAVAPLIELVNAGGRIDVNIKGPKGNYWRS